MGASAPVVRDATADDAAVCAAIYTPYVTDTAITFELEPPSEAQMAGRIAAAQRAHAWLVLADEGVVVGYAYAGPYKERAAYRWSCEVSVYLDGGRRRRGGDGRTLYEALFARLADRGFRTAVAGITLPNEPSVGLHTAMGFEPIGTYRRIGFKQGMWRDVLWTQRALGSYDADPVEPV
ncbi:GNAT family N-acetyltransferase [Blastococcus atacamensis]|uniref:GNAT family N-acetyltransferase n=1 Tax=Blastococcus atacamensis TaxID=2070508 RepID=UPI000CEB9F54|nr:GNAT family N-acetyltransferase [Blastococcus atacamensis]